MHVWNCWEAALNVMAPVPVMIKEAAEAGYTRFRFDSKLPPGFTEDEASTPVYNRPLPDMEDAGDDDGEGVGQQDHPPFVADIVTDELVGRATVLTDDEMAAYDARGASLEERASYERTCLENVFQWGALRGARPGVDFFLPPSVVHRYRGPDAATHHMALCLAVARAPRPGDYQPLSLSDAIQRTRVGLREEQVRRAACPHSVLEQAVGTLLTDVSLALTALTFFGVREMAELQGATLSHQILENAGPVFMLWARGQVGYSNRMQHVTFDRCSHRPSIRMVGALLGKFLRVFGFAHRWSARGLSFMGPNLWALSVGQGMLANDFRPPLYTDAYVLSG